MWSLSKLGTVGVLLTLMLGISYPSFADMSDVEKCRAFALTGIRDVTIEVLYPTPVIDIFPQLAVPPCRRLTQIHPENSSYWFMLGRALLMAELRGMSDLFRQNSPMGYVGALERAIELDDASAMELLATIRFVGVGVPVDRESARDLWRKSVELGGGSTRFYAALFILSDETSSPALIEKAITLVRNAADRNVVGSKEVLSIVEERGAAFESADLEPLFLKLIEAAND